MNKKCPHCGRACNPSETIRLEIKNGKRRIFGETTSYCGRRNCALAIMAGLQVKVSQTHTKDSSSVIPDSSKTANSNT